MATEQIKQLDQET
jgi:chromosome segregation ATPase